MGDRAGKITGWWRVVTRDASGRVKFDSGRHNLVVDAAKPYLGDVLRGAANPLGAIAIGSGATAADAADTTLETELARLGIPAPGTDTATQKNVRSGNVVEIRETFTGIADTINEMGLFGGISSPPGAADEGTLFNRVIIGPDTVIVTDNTTVFCTLTFN